jgi:hypothetical protein
VFPTAQLQLCVYHINSNISSRIRAWFKGAAFDDDGDDLAASLDDEGDEDELARLIDDDFNAA